MRIVIFRMKHGSCHYLYTDEQWPRICTAHFRGLDDMGWYVKNREDLGDTEPPEPSVGPMTYLEGAEMPDWAREEYEAKLKKHRTACTRVRVNDHYWEYLCDARNGILEAAQAIIEDDKNSEYGGYVIDTLEDVIDTLEDVIEDIPHYVFPPNIRVAYLTRALQQALDGELDRAEKSLFDIFGQAEGPCTWDANAVPESDRRESWTKRATLLAHNLRRVIANPDDESLNTRVNRWIERWGAGFNE